MKVKTKKTKEERAGPRRRRKKKKNKQVEVNENENENDSDSDFNLDTSDLLEQISQGSNSSSQRKLRSYWNSRTIDALSQANSINVEHSDWLVGLLGHDSKKNFNVMDGLVSPPRRRLFSHETDSSDAWLDLQAEWLFSKQYLIDAEYALETAERKKWSEWAVHAAEIERRRRIQVMDEIDKSELRERQRRQQWAIAAIERERNERISTQFLTNLTATNWFNETISSYNDDYDVVCPYYKLGCRSICRKTNIQKHMKSCKYAIEAPHHSDEKMLTDYEVVCPNCVLGCVFIGSRIMVQKHLAESCLHKGKSRQEENDERQMIKEIVISECEEERVRRVNGIIILYYYLILYYYYIILLY